MSPTADCSDLTAATKAYSPHLTANSIQRRKSEGEAEAAEAAEEEEEEAAEAEEEGLTCQLT
jgi:hypothetical protein